MKIKAYLIPVILAGLVFATSLTVRQQLIYNSHAQQAYTPSGPWYSTISPTRTLYVSTNGAGNGTEVSPMSAQTAFSSALAGDLYIFLPGTYNLGTVSLSKSGTLEKPIVYKGQPNSRVTVNGAFEIYGNYVWLWGFEITGSQVSDKADISLYGKGIKVINNVIQGADSGVGAWDKGQQVVYGNIFYAGRQQQYTQRTHFVYAQNDFYTHGYKYFVNNIFIDPALQSCNLVKDASGTVTGAQDCYLYHAYTEGGLISGMHLEKNVFSSGKFLIGGYNKPADREVLKENVFYNASPQLGYRRPTQVDMLNNYIVGGTLGTDWWWGDGEVTYTQNGPNRYLYNEVYSSGQKINIRTSAYTSAGRQEGIPKLRSVDEMNYNKYSSPFSAHLLANNSDRNVNTLPDWQSATEMAGKKFDSDSQIVSLPTTPKVFIFPNDYEKGRGHIAIVNWNKSGNISVNISSFLDLGATYKITLARDPYGTPVASGIFSGSNINIPLSGKDFEVFLVTSNLTNIANTSSPTPTLSPTPTPTKSPSPTPTPSPTTMPSILPTLTAAPTAKPTATPVKTTSPTPLKTSSPKPGSTLTPSPSPIGTPRPRNEWWNNLQRRFQLFIYRFFNRFNR